MNNFAQNLEIYHRTGDICAYLNITQITKSDVDNLAGKFAFLDAQNGWNQSLLNMLFSSFVHQMIVAKCAFDNNQNKITTLSYYNSTLVWYDERGVMLPFLPWIILPAIFAAISIILNLSLIIVSVKKICLDKLCNSMLLYDSLCQIFIVFPFIINLFALVVGISAIDFKICLFALMISTGCSYASFMAIYFISFERLLIVFFPIRMHCISPSRMKMCSLIVFVFCFFFGTITTLTVFNVLTIINLPYYRFIFCNTGLYSDTLNTPTSYILLLLSFINYLFIFVKILWNHFQKKKNANYAGNKELDKGIRRMLRSVLIISGVILIGWMLISVARNYITYLIHAFAYWIVPNFVTDPMAASRISGNLSSLLIGLTTSLSIFTTGTSALILIFCNSEYRNAYKAVFIFWAKTPIGPLIANGNE